MSAPLMGSEQALASIEARLSRPPQDALEGAIVLEAWAGVSPAAALELGRDVMPYSRRPQATATGIRRRDLQPPSTLRVQGVALLVMLVAVSLWARPLIGWVGATGFALAWRVALPLVLGLQWVLQSRFAEGERLGQLRPHVGTVVTLAACLGLAVGLVPAPAAVTVLGLMLPWLGMVVVAEARLWAVAQCGLVLTASVWMYRGIEPRLVLVGLAVSSGALVLVAIVRTAPSDVRLLPRGQSLAAGLVGGGIGLLLVIGVPAELTGREPFLALLMIPSVVGGLVGAEYLRRLWVVIPRSLTSVTVLGSQHVSSSPAVRVFLVAVARYVVVVVTLTVALFTLGASPQEGWLELAVGYGTIGLAGLLASLSWSYGRRAFTVGAVGAALLAVVAVRAGLPGSDLGLTIGAGVLLLVLLDPVIGALLRVEQQYATRLQIP